MAAPNTPGTLCDAVLYWNDVLTACPSPPPSSPSSCATASCSASRRHPAYGWDANMGYGTPAHQAGLLAAGPCVHHRRSFAPVSQLALGLVEGGTAPPRERALALGTASAPSNDGAPRR